MGRLPDALFVIDTRKEQIAVDEARKLKIPVIGIVDTNCDPDEVDYVIPGNDDALRSVKLFVSRIADAVISGRGERESAMAEQAHERRRSGGRRRSAPHGAPGGPPQAAASGRDPSAARRNRSSATPLSRRLRSHGRRDSCTDMVLRSCGYGLRHDRQFVASPSDLKTQAPRLRRYEMAATAAQVKELRDKTGAGMMDCKAALDGSGRRHREGRRAPAQEGPGAGRQARGTRRQGRHHRPLHPHGRQGRRARRGELRDRLRRAHAGLPDARQGDRDAHRRGQPAGT